MTTSYEFDDDLYPGTTAVFIRATWYGHGTYTGSGVLVGRNDILTAAHVIYDVALGGIADRIELFPSYDPDTFFNQTVEWSVVHYFPNFDPDGDGALFPGDFNSGTLGQTELDIALFTLSEAAGDIYGYMGIDYDFDGGSVGVVGYPGIYGLQPIYDEGSVRKAFFNDSAFLYNRDIEVNPGNSGGPIFYDYGFGPYVVGIVSTGIAAVNVAGHFYWLRDYIRDNDVAIGGGTFDPNAEISPSLNDGDNRWNVTVDDSFLNGMGGFDTALFSFATTDTRAWVRRDGIEVNAQVAGNHTDVWLVNFEEFEFTDRSLLLSEYNNVVAINPAQFEDLVKLYVAYFDRAPDALGIYYWADKLVEGTSLEQISKDFFNSLEARALYGDASNINSFVASVYENVLGRTFDQEGFLYWSNELRFGNLSSGQFVLEIIRGAQGDDITYLEQKKDLGLYYSAILGLSDGSDAQNIMHIFGNQETSNLTGAKTAADNHFRDAIQPDANEFIVHLVGVVDDPFGN
ncbi:MAG: DUF4214 domain-containing protein [Aestuariivita sp.]|nr:DUF4214 domain-containing protein [Aestuariivita sp.]MCY4202766.1 DUF4214 domain-containing protein [Aestuariivita sp.]MCY4289141.1 DUF4214 domain-containing protein [Aestuariivita sp.]MCY4347944.1 DUF4214 domain-containing protein [Aestuariivita sp.]